MALEVQLLMRTCHRNVALELVAILRVVVAVAHEPVALELVIERHRDHGEGEDDQRRDSGADPPVPRCHIRHAKQHRREREHDCRLQRRWLQVPRDDDRRFDPAGDVKDERCRGQQQERLNQARHTRCTSTPATASHGQIHIGMPKRKR